jgi:hypothetical protein
VVSAALRTDGGLDYLPRWSALQLLVQMVGWTTYPGGQRYSSWYRWWAGLLTQVTSTTAPSTGGGIDYLPRWHALQLLVQVVGWILTQVASTIAPSTGGGIDYLPRWPAPQLLVQVVGWTTYPGGQHYSS